MADAIIIGGGHNALVTAFYLAKAGRKPLVLERRPVVGGCATSEEFAPGYRGATLAHTLGPLRPSIVRDMQLERRGVKFVHPDPRLVSVGTDGRALVFSTDPGRTADAIRPFSAKDATRYPEFCATLGRLGAFLSELLEMTPPSIDAPSAGELWELLKTGRKFRALGKKESFALLRWGPMAVADLVAEWFETDLLQASVAARGDSRHRDGAVVRGHRRGAAARRRDRSRARRQQRDGGGRSRRGHARDGRGGARSGRRDPHRRRGAADPREGRRRHRRRARGRNGDSPPPTVVSGADPRRTLPAARRSGRARAGLHDAHPELPLPGHGREAELRSARAAGVPRRHRRSRRVAAAAACTIGPGIDYLERAFDASKYGEMSAAPYLDIAFPSVARSVDGAGGPARDVGAHAVRAVHAARRILERPGATRSRTWSCARSKTTRPASTALVEHRQVITPLDLEQVYGLTGGHIHHGELALDQLFTMRPDARLGRLPHAARRPLPLRLGHPSRQRPHRRVGPECRARDPQGTATHFDPLGASPLA